MKPFSGQHFCKCNENAQTDQSGTCVTKPLGKSLSQSCYLLSGMPQIVLTYFIFFIKDIQRSKFRFRVFGRYYESILVQIQGYCS